MNQTHFTYHINKAFDPAIHLHTYDTLTNKTRYPSASLRTLYTCIPYRLSALPADLSRAISALAAASMLRVALDEVAASSSSRWLHRDAVPATMSRARTTFPPAALRLLSRGKGDYVHERVQCIASEPRERYSVIRSNFVD